MRGKPDNLSRQTPVECVCLDYFAGKSKHLPEPGVLAGGEGYLSYFLSVIAETGSHL